MDVVTGVQDSRSGNGREGNRTESNLLGMELVSKLAGVYFSAQFPFLEMSAFP